MHCVVHCHNLTASHVPSSSMWRRDPMWLWVTRAFILSPFADQHSRQCDGISPWKATLQGKWYTEHIIHTCTFTSMITQLVTEIVRWLVVTPIDPLPLLCCNHTTRTNRDHMRAIVYALTILQFTQLSQLIKILITIIKIWCHHQTF